MLTTTFSFSWRIASSITTTSFSIATAPARFAIGLCAHRIASLVDEVSFKLFHSPLIFFFCPCFSSVTFTDFHLLHSSHRQYTTTSPVLVDFFDISEIVEGSQSVHTKLDSSHATRFALEAFVNSDDDDFSSYESDSASFISESGVEESTSSSSTSSPPPSPLFESKFDFSAIVPLDLEVATPYSEALDSFSVTPAIETTTPELVVALPRPTSTISSPLDTEPVHTSLVDSTPLKPCEIDPKTFAEDWSLEDDDSFFASHPLEVVPFEVVVEAPLEFIEKEDEDEEEEEFDERFTHLPGLRKPFWRKYFPIVEGDRPRFLRRDAIWNSAGRQGLSWWIEADFVRRC